MFNSPVACQHNCWFLDSPVDWFIANWSTALSIGWLSIDQWHCQLIDSAVDWSTAPSIVQQHCHMIDSAVPWCLLVSLYVDTTDHSESANPLLTFVIASHGRMASFPAETTPFLLQFEGARGSLVQEIPRFLDDAADQQQHASSLSFCYSVVDTYRKSP
jgi:hypothetical protein